MKVKSDLLRPGATGGSCVVAALALLGSAGVVSAEASEEAAASRLVESSVSALEVHKYVVTAGGEVVRSDGQLSGNRSTCNQELSTYSALSWNINPGEGLEVGVQAGFVEGEIMATEYELAEDAFPIRLDTIEAIIATAGANVSTVTAYTVLVWEGNPETGTLIASFSSADPAVDPAAPANVELPPGNNGVILSFQIDPQAAPSDQIFIGEGSPPPGNTFSIGVRIDEHNNQIGNGCLFPPPQTSNAFPTTDSISPNFAFDRQSNWLFAIDCGPISAAPPGWSRFSELTPVFGQRIEPGGDWNLRARWTSFNPACGTVPFGCCCLPGGFNFPNFQRQDCENGGGFWAGGGTDCTEPGICEGVFGCPEDIAGDDSVINTLDLLSLLANFNTPGPIGDIDQSGTVDTADLLRLLAAFNNTCDQL